MNRRQFTQSIAALFAAPAMPAVALTQSAAQTTVPSMAYCWADYLTRMHKVCSPQMLAPFLRVDQQAAHSIHAQLVAENYLTASGAAHPNLIARQPRSIPQGATKTVEPKQRTTRAKPKSPVQSDNTIRAATDEDIPDLVKIWDETIDQSQGDIKTYIQSQLANITVIGPIGAPVGFYLHDGGAICAIYTTTDDAKTALFAHADQAGLSRPVTTPALDQEQSQ